MEEPMNYEDAAFDDTTVEVDGNRYARCVFRNCTLSYNGGEIPQLLQNEFHSCKWEFNEAAQRTLVFLSALYRGGFEKLIEATFDNVRKSFRVN
jgi:hypothetical protein